MGSKKDFGNAAFMWLAPALHQAPRPLVVERHARSSVNPRFISMFVGSELAGQRAAMVMSLVQSARINGHDPSAYLSDALRRLPTQLSPRLEELLPHRWAPATD